MRSALLYTLLALFATAAQGAQTGLCTRLLQARYQVLQHEEAQLLKLFNASVFEDPSAELTVLSSRGVFAVVDPQTQMKYVIRFPGPFSDTQFEELLAEAAKRAPGVETVLLHRLSEPESAKILEQLDLREPKMMEAVRAEWAKKHFKLPENARATVAVFVPATGGEKVLRELGVTGGVQKALLKLAEPENLAKLRAHEKFFHRSMELEIEVGWNNATDAEKQLLMEDLKALYPESIPVTVDHYKNWILNNLARIAGDQPERILWLSLERIPPMLRRQLADYWAFSTLWGITDPRPANWLMREGQVLALDFAFKTRTFKEGAAVIGVVGETKFPFGPGPLREGMRDFLLANISSDMRKWLSSLDSRQIEAMMKASGHPIVRAEVSGVVKRAKLLSAGRQPGLRR